MIVRRFFSFALRLFIHSSALLHIIYSDPPLLIYADPLLPRS